MYLVGRDGPSKRAARAAVEDSIRNRVKMVSDAEVLHEILHRYVAIDRRDAIVPALRVIEAIADEISDIAVADVHRARDIVLIERRVSARDAIHLAVMERYGISQVMTFDRDFDAWPGIERIPR
jgi:predicted nucleic acid-binding protein